MAGNFLLGIDQCTTNTKAVLADSHARAGGGRAVEAALVREYSALLAKQLRRYARLYGTRARDLLAGATKPADLGRWFGTDL